MCETLQPILAGMKKLKEEADEDLLWELKMAVGRKKALRGRGPFQRLPASKPNFYIVI